MRSRAGSYPTGSSTCAVIHLPLLSRFRVFGSTSVTAGVIDSSRFKGAAEVGNLRASTVTALEKYVRMARSGGMYAEYWYALGTDAIDEVEKLCEQVVERFPRAVFFAGKLVFSEENLLTRLLHNQAAHTLQRRLQFKGLPLVVLPVRAM